MASLQSAYCYNDQQDGFYIIEEFAALSTHRKMQLCQIATTGRRDRFENAVYMIWPNADRVDVKKLEHFALLVCETKNRVH